MNFKLGMISLISLLAVSGCGGSSSGDDETLPPEGFVSKNEDRGRYSSPVFYDEDGRLSSLVIYLTNESTLYIQYRGYDGVVSIMDNSFSENITLYPVLDNSKNPKISIQLTASLNGRSVSTYEVKDEYGQVAFSGAFDSYLIANESYIEPISFFEQEFIPEVSAEKYKWLGNNTFQIEKDNCTYIGGNLNQSFEGDTFLYTYDFEILENTCPIADNKGLIITGSLFSTDYLTFTFQTETSLEGMTFNKG